MKVSTAATAAVLATGIAGCSLLAQPLSLDDYVFVKAAPGKTRAVYSKNYRIGERYTSAVGESMATIKNYDVIERVARAVALQDIVQLCGSSPCDSGPLEHVRASLGKVYPVDGAITEDGFPYFMVRLPGPAGETEKSSGGTAYILADPDGFARAGAYVGWRAEDEPRSNQKGVPVKEVTPKVALEAKGALFAYETDQTVVRGGSRYLNYELVYEGLEYHALATRYRVRYREFHSSQAEVPVHQESLSFPVSQTTFDVLGLRVAVHEATDSAIEFTVLEDAIAETAR